MGLFDWFRKKKKTPKITTTEAEKNTLQNMAVAAAFAEAGEHDTARSIIDQEGQRPARKILAVGREDHFSDLLTDYSLDMARRLGVELIALNVTAAPLSLPSSRREETSQSFKESCIANAQQMVELAKSKNVSFTHLVEIGDPDEIIEQMQVKYAGVRYILTEPDPEVVKESNGKASIPVFAVGYSQAA